MKIYSNRRYVRASAHDSNYYFNVDDSKDAAVNKIIDFLLDNPEMYEQDRVYLHFDYPDDDGNIYLYHRYDYADTTTWVGDYDVNDRINRHYERTGTDIDFDSAYYDKLMDKIWKKRSKWMRQVAADLYDDVMKSI